MIFHWFKIVIISVIIYRFMNFEIFSISDKNLTYHEHMFFVRYL